MENHGDFRQAAGAERDLEFVGMEILITSAAKNTEFATGDALHPAVAPLPNIARHVVAAVGAAAVFVLSANGFGEAAVGLAAGLQIGVGVVAPIAGGGVPGVAPGIGAAVLAAGGFFPFDFGGQAICLARFCHQPVAVSFRFVVIQSGNGGGIVLERLGVLQQFSKTKAFFFRSPISWIVIACVFDKTVELPLRCLMQRDGKGWAIDNGLGYIPAPGQLLGSDGGRGSVDELPGGNEDHLEKDGFGGESGKNEQGKAVTSDE